MSTGNPVIDAWRRLDELADERERLTALIENIRKVLINERLQNFSPRMALEKITDLLEGRGNP